MINCATNAARLLTLSLWKKRHGRSPLGIKAERVFQNGSVTSDWCQECGRRKHGLDSGAGLRSVRFHANCARHGIGPVKGAPRGQVHPLRPHRSSIGRCTVSATAAAFVVFLISVVRASGRCQGTTSPPNLYATPTSAV